MTKEYIEREAVLKKIEDFLHTAHIQSITRETEEEKTLWRGKRGGVNYCRNTVIEAPAADVVEVVRCKDCKWFMPKHVLTDSGERRPYTEEEKKLPLGVMGDVGINCGSRCCRYMAWENNRVPVYVQETDFCSYGERKEQG